MSKLACTALLCLVAFATPARAEQPVDVKVPPPVSGRSPDRVTAADNLARVRLIEDNLQVVRAFMGRPAPPPVLLRVQGAQAREVFYQSYNLRRRARALSFEHLRTSLDIPEPLRTSAKPSDVFRQLDDALLSVLRVKHSLGIERSVPEQAMPDATTATDVFNGIVQAGQLMHVLLDRKTTSTDVYGGITLAMNIATAMHSKTTRSFLPPKPAFEPNRPPSDVFHALHACLDSTRALGQAHGVEMLRFELPPTGERYITPDEVTSLLALLVAELSFMHGVLLGAPPQIPIYRSGRRYPSHNLQRTRHLNAVLQGLVAVSPRKR